jgi:hypothetical protein
VSGASQPLCLLGFMPSPQHAWQGEAADQGPRPPWLMPHDAPGPWFPRKDDGPARPFIHALGRFARRPPREHDRRLSQRWTSRALSAQNCTGSCHVCLHDKTAVVVTIHRRTQRSAGGSPLASGAERDTSPHGRKVAKSHLPVTAFDTRQVSASPQSVCTRY